MVVGWLFLAVPWGCLRFVIVVFPGHTHLLFLRYTGYQNVIKDHISHVYIANSSSCTTTELSIILTSCLTAIINHVIKYCETVFERNDKNLFLSVKNAGEILNKLKSKCFLASSVSRYDFSTLYTTFYFITSSEFNAYQM